jgi:hypothetical protein
VVSEAAPTPIAPSPDGQFVRLLVLPLERIPAGDYDLVLHVKDLASGVTQEKVERLRLNGYAG